MNIVILNGLFFWPDICFDFNFVQDPLHIPDFITVEAEKEKETSREVEQDRANVANVGDDGEEDDDDEDDEDEEDEDQGEPGAPNQEPENTMLQTEIKDCLQRIAMKEAELDKLNKVNALISIIFHVFHLYFF